MTLRIQIVLAALAASPVIGWVRSGGKVARTTRARLGVLAGCAALMVIALTVGAIPAVHADYPANLVILLTVGVLVVLRPRLASRLVPTTLILLGLYCYVVAQNLGLWEYAAGYRFLPFPYYVGPVYAMTDNDAMRYGLALPLTYGLMLLGGWLAWRQADRNSPAARLVLGRMADPDSRSHMWGFLLLPVAFMAAQLFCREIWFGGGPAGVAFTVVILASAFAMVRRWPGHAASLATGGLIIVGLASAMSMTLRFNLILPRPENRFGLDWSRTPPGLAIAHEALVQAVALIGFGLLLVPRTIPPVRRLLGWASDPDLISRVQRLTESRAVAVDTAAADLRKLERDLHDGAQARLVALGMNLRAAERLIPTSPQAAMALIAEARETSARALAELRELVRGVHPPVLADRGLGDALRALALDAPMKVDTDIDLPSRLPGPVETACYFAVAEVLTNAAKRSGARDGRISASHDDGMLRIAVTDFGVGGADSAGGTGLAGVEQRLAAFDGIVAVSSPIGGPTMVVMEVPCASSSQKISSC